MALLARRREGEGLLAGEADLDLGGWSKTDSRALERAAACPILLLDLNFQRVDWWEQAVRGSIPHRPSGGGTWFSSEDARPLVQEILTEAWSIGRSMPRAANLIFGMAPAVTAAIASLGAAEIDRIAVECIPYLRPRWLDRPTFGSTFSEQLAARTMKLWRMCIFTCSDSSGVSSYSDPHRCSRPDRLGPWPARPRGLLDRVSRRDDAVRGSAIRLPSTTLMV